MTDPTPADLTRSLVEAYADAVVAFLMTDVPQGIDYNLETERFVYGPMEDGVSPTDVGLWVSDRWIDTVGDIGMDLTHITLQDLELLREVLVRKLTGSETAAYLARALAKQARTWAEEGAAMELLDRVNRPLH